CYDNKPNNLYGKQKLIFVGRYFSKLAIISLFFHLLLFRFCLGDLKSFCLYGDIVLIANLTCALITCALITCALFIVWLMLLLTSARLALSGDRYCNTIFRRLLLQLTLAALVVRLNRYKI